MDDCWRAAADKTSWNYVGAWVGRSASAGEGSLIGLSVGWQVGCSKAAGSASGSAQTPNRATAARRWART